MICDWRTSGSTHTAAVGAGIGRKASQPLPTAMDRNRLLHCLLLVCSLHRVTMFPKYCLPACYSLNCSWCVGTLTRVKRLNHFFHRHWRLRQHLSYTCSCNWYMNGKFFTSTTEWKQKIKFSFLKMFKLNFDLYFDLCRSVEFTLVSSISVLH